MERERLRADRLRVGTLLEFDVYDAEGRLLLRRGYRIDSPEQLERVVQRGAFTVEPQAGAHVAAHDDELLVHFQPRRPGGVRLSVFELMREAGKRLDDLYSIESFPGQFAVEIGLLADGVRKCCALDSDAALAHILLSKELRYPVRQSLNVAILTALMLARQKHDDASTAEAVAAALTMNLSIASLQDELYRQRDPLTDEQRRILRDHPRASVRELTQRGVTAPRWLQAVGQHHEARDGSGYPDGAAGDAIVREAQVIGLADRYCSMVNERAHRPGMAPGLALKEIHGKHGGAIDPAWIGSLLATMGLYPPGTCVELANGEIGVVTHRLLDARHPVVHALYQHARSPYESPRKRLTASNRQFEIVRAVPFESVVVVVDPEQLWPRSSAGDAGGVSPQRRLIEVCG